MLEVSVEIVGAGVPLPIGHQQQHPQETQVCWERRHSPWSGRVPNFHKPMAGNGMAHGLRTVDVL